MFLTVLRMALPVAVAAALGPACAYADIYTWLDASGALNVSNLEPPSDARVIKIMRTSEESAGASAAKADTQALADRVTQLENELDKRQAPPTIYAPAPPVIQYVVAPPPPMIQYVIAPPVVQYVSDFSPANPCDPSSLNCGLGWQPAFYPASVVVVPASHNGRFKPGGDLRVHSPRIQPPMQTSLIQPLASPLIQPLTIPLVQPLVGPSVPTFVPTPRAPGFPRG
jgi:hypothetical protein